MVDVVGLRFVSEGGEKAVQDLNKYKNAQNDLASATQKNITFSQRNAAQLRSVAQAYASGAITLREAGNLTEDLTQRTTALARAAGATDAQLVSLVQRFNEMADAALSAARAQEAAADYERRIAAQLAFNEQLGVSGKLATEMGASFSQFATVLDNLDASARQFTSDLNERLGVTGQRAVEVGNSFGLIGQRAVDAGLAFSGLATVLDNLDASARKFTSDLNDRLGVTGQRAVEVGNSFGLIGQRAVDAGQAFSNFRTVLDNLDATARRFTSDLNERLGVTGQRAVEVGNSFGLIGQRAVDAGQAFSNFRTVLDNLDATARRFTSELNDRLGVTGQRAIQSGAGYEALEADIRSAETALKNFQASFDPTAAAARRLENAHTVLANAVRTGAITQEESNRIMQQYRGALDDTAKANEILRRETQALAIAYNPVMAAQTVYERKQQELNRAHELGVLSADKLQAELTQLAAAYNSIGGSTLNAQRFTNQFGENVRIAGIKTNRFGMVAQQVGYQVGDFFVQIQSGTNAFVAFGQQATQLAGILPGLAGAIVGISISVGTMLLAAWDRTRKAASDADEAFKDLGSTLGRLDDVRLDNLNTEIADGARTAAAEYERVLNLMERVELRALQNILRNQSAAVEAMIQNQRALQGVAAQAGADFNFDVMGLDSFNEAIFLAAQLRTLTGDTREELLQQVTAIEEALTLRGLMNPQVEALVAKLAEEVGLIEAAGDAADAQNEALAATTEHLAAQVTHQQQIATIQMTVNERREAYRKTVDDANRSIKEQIALNATILQFGEDSRQVEAVRAAQAREAYRQQQLAAGIVGNHLKDLMRQYDLAVLIAKAVEDSADNAEDLRSTVASTDLSGLAAQAALLASNMGVAADEAVRYNAALNRQAGIPDNTGQPRLGFGGIGSMEDGPGLGTGFARIGFGNLDQPRLRTRTPMATPAGGGGGGGGGAAAAQDDYLKNLLLEAEQKRRLVGLSEEETRRQEILFELEKRDLSLKDDRIEKIIQTEAETRKLIEAEQQRQQLMDTVENHIQSAFMAMVDGSSSVEDAFRNMLRNIILAIYEQQVAEPAARGIGNFLSGAIGGLFGPGMTTGTPLQIPSSGIKSLLPSFDGGGYTGTGARSGGLDGRGGMLAMVHPNETVVDHSKGQSMGNVTVVQNFNIAANGDDSVRRIVQQEAPRIAEQAKAAVVDAKRRGGAYGRSF